MRWQKWVLQRRIRRDRRKLLREIRRRRGPLIFVGAGFSVLGVAWLVWRFARALVWQSQRGVACYSVGLRYPPTDQPAPSSWMDVMVAAARQTSDAISEQGSVEMSSLLATATLAGVGVVLAAVHVVLSGWRR